MFLEISKANYIEDYKIEFGFNNGEIYLVDLINEMNGSVFLPLKNKEFFKDFSIVYNTIEWKNGADFAPEYLYELAKLQNKLVSEPEAEYKTK
jgi:phosphoribosylaminoimidazole-succinocarboxamide synthase